ncbi:hypothetical protein JM18_004953 [Phytophthora kernoviae]|uniref:Uncharacterized protein n=2 Tax=Phytophthora kernoviae TaxID=325452 RepID=A0A8T0LVY4_9STRA|nr:hypothetical protein G195_006449 [Phytophthora kernoviae 00238/432]KAG2523131.1 hypothetical protein JM16_005372 [Phytophthora kernoviae]KAG2524846.1 hypothetical protein JM18_004953 [Phytophthora kernoviae]
MARKWFQLKGEDGSALTSATSVLVDVEDVDTFRKAVKQEYSDSDLAGIAASNLTVFANQAAYDAKQALPRSSSSVTKLGKDEDNALIVQVRRRAGVASETSATAQMEKKIDEMHEQVVQTKRKRYVHSEMSSNKGNALLQDLNIRVKPARSVPFATGDPTPAEAFTWESVCDERGQIIVLTEEQQRERYRTYVEDNIGDVLARKQLCVLGVEKGKNILSATVPGHDVDLVGRTDMLVLSDLAKQFPLHLELLPEVKMLIEVKRKVKGGSVFQALSELIALDVLVDDPVMALLTDLTGHWQMLLAQSPTSDADISLPCFEEPVKRRKLAQLLPSVSEGGESSDIRAAIERYYDIASVLGPDIDMARAAANQIARTIPVFSYYT